MLSKKKIKIKMHISNCRRELCAEISSSIQTKEFIFSPYSFDPGSILPAEHALTIDCVIFEVALKDLAITEVELTLTFLIVHDKLAFVLNPEILDLGPILVFERGLKLSDFLIVKRPIPMKLIILPVPIIGDLVIRIV